MESMEKVIAVALLACVCLSTGSAYADKTTRVPEDVLVFDSAAQDFVLPSYFDGVPAPSPQPMTFAPNTTSESKTVQQIPDNVDILKEIFGDEEAVTSAPPKSQPPVATMPVGQVFYPQPQVIRTEVKTQPLLTPLPPIPPAPEANIPPKTRTTPVQLYSSKILAKEMGKSKTAIILPKDMRLQFSPGSAQLAHSNLKWITAYALHVQKDPRLVVEIRVSQNDWTIQRSRLNLIVQTLLQRGLPSRQIRILRTDRDADSLILGYNDRADQTKIIVPDEVPRKIKQQKTLSW